MKRLLAWLLCGLMVAAMFAGCAKNTTDTTSGGAQAKTETTVEGNDSNLIVYTQKTLDQYFHVALQEELEKAVKAAGYEAEVTNCNNDSAVQVTQMQNTIAKKPKAIIANSVDSDGFNDAVEQAVAAGIPVIEVDNPASTAVVDGTVAFGNYELGEIAAEQIAQKLTEKYGEAKGLVVDVYGAMSSECWRLRKDGFDSKMKEYPNIVVVETPGEGEQAKSQDALTNVIAQYGEEIDAVFCPSDAPGIGCAEALQMANMWVPIGEEGHVIFFTVYGEQTSVQGIRDGYYDCTNV